jgi:hypothetical protein
LSDSILLVDSSLNISEIKKTYEKSTLIISFDHESHKQLNKKQIPHICSDQFLSENDVDKIQKTAYRLVYWYNENKIQNFIKYETINIGKLFHEEIMDYLVKFVKSFFEINQIYKKYPNASFSTSFTLYEIMILFTSEIQKLPSITSQKYANDKIRVNFKIGKKYFMFFISKSNYQKIKKLYEKIVHLIMGPKKTFNSNLKNILLVEFNTIRFKEFFLANKSDSVHLSFFGRRRPAFWNLHSYSIFKKSNSKIISSYAIDNKKLESSTKIGIIEMKNKLKSLWANKEFFDEFFIINDISIWDSIKSTFFELLENRIKITIYEIELCNLILEKYRFDNILILSEIGFTEQIILNLSKKYKIQTTLIQPGLYYDTKEANDMNISQGAYPIQSDKFIVWGNVAKNDSLSNAKISIDKIEVIGPPRYDKQKLSNNPIPKHYILLATSAPQPADIHGLLINNIENYENSIMQIAQIASKLKIPLVIKLHASPNEPDVDALISHIDHDITVVTSGDIFPLLQSCSVMIVLGLSTAIIEAQILRKPVISIPIIDYKWGNPEVFKSNSCVISDVNSLEDNLDKILNDKKFCNQLIYNADKFLESYIRNLGSGPEKIFSYFSKL